MAPWLRTIAPKVEAQVQSLVEEDPTCCMARPEIKKKFFLICFEYMKFSVVASIMSPITGKHQSEGDPTLTVEVSDQAARFYIFMPFCSSVLLRCWDRR